MTSPDSPFTRAEYARRIERVREAMAARGLDQLLITNASNIAYLTGYIGESAYVPQLLSVWLEADPQLHLRDMDVSGCLHTSYLASDRVVGYPEEWIGDPDRSAYSLILDAVRSSAVRRVGAELGEMTRDTLRIFESAFPADVLRDASGLVTWLRLVKSPAEIGLIRQAAQICDRAMQRAYEVVRPGVRECDAAAEVIAALVRGTEHFGGHFAYSPYMPSGSRTGTAHLTWTDRPYERDTSVNLEIGASRYGYTGALMRSISLGVPSDRLRRVHAATLEGAAAALEAMRPGTTCGEVAAAFGRVVSRHGFEKKSRCGYPIGIHWLEPTASLRIGDRTVLEPGMTFHLMLGMWIERDFGHVFSETVGVTESGAESMATLPRTLAIVA